MNEQERLAAIMSAPTPARTAQRLFESGYNCAQSVAGAFWRQCGLSLAQMLALSAGFGGGFSRLREMCGAVSGMVMVMGAVLAAEGVGPEQKAENYRQVRAQIATFEKDNGSYLCRDLLGLGAGRRDDPTPAERTHDYYATRPCLRMILYAVQLTQDWLAMRGVRVPTDGAESEKAVFAGAEGEKTVAAAAEKTVFSAAEGEKTVFAGTEKTVFSAAEGEKTVFAGTEKTIAAMPAEKACGISVPAVSASPAEDPAAPPPEALDAVWYAAHLPRRQPDGHKGTFGRLLAVCGSAQYRGAALLAGEGALRSGAGLVQLAAPPAVCAAMAVRRPEAILLPLDADTPAQNAAKAAAAARQATALLVGCGLGKGEEAAALVAALLAPQTLPAVVDADALDLLAALPQPLTLPADTQQPQTAAAPRVLTPHIGEMARLLAVSPKEILADQLAAARRGARDFGSVVVLKGSRTVIAAPDGRALWLAAPNSGLAKGGSGDVLAGLLGGLLAQGVPAFEAAGLAVWQHSAAAARAAKKHGAAAMLPGDVLAELQW